MDNPPGGGGSGSATNANVRCRAFLQSHRLIDSTMQATGGIYGAMLNPWANLNAQGSAQNSTAPQNQEMDLDLDVQEEEQVSQLLNAPMFRIVIPGMEDLREVDPMF